MTAPTPEPVDVLAAVAELAAAQRKGPEWTTTYRTAYNDALRDVDHLLGAALGLLRGEPVDAMDAEILARAQMLAAVRRERALTVEAVGS